MVTCPLCGQSEPDSAAQCSACGKELQPAAAVEQTAAAPVPKVRSASAFKGTLMMPSAAAGGLPAHPAAGGVAAKPPAPASAPVPVPPAASAAPTFKRPALGGATMIGGMVAPPPMAPPPPASQGPSSTAKASADFALDQTVHGITPATLDPKGVTPAPQDQATSAGAAPTSQQAQPAEAPKPVTQPQAAAPALALSPADSAEGQDEDTKGGLVWLLIGFVGMLALAAVAVLAAKFMGLL